MLLTHPDTPKDSYLFSGDIILGTPSTTVQDLHVYMDTLYKLRKEEFNHICLPHSLDLSIDQVIVDGPSKLEDYIKYREEREHHIKEVFKKRGTLTQDELYDDVYGARNLNSDLAVAAHHNLELNLEKLKKDGFIVGDGEVFKLAKL